MNMKEPKDLTWGEILKAIKGHWEAYKTTDGKRKFDHYGMALDVYRDWAIAHHVGSFLSTLKSVNDEAQILTEEEINDISQCLRRVAENSMRELEFYKESESEDE